MMHGHEKLDPLIVAAKPANKVAPRSWSNPRRDQLRRSRWSEGRGPRGMRISKARAGHRAGQACHRRWTAYGEWQGNLAVTHPRWEPYAGKPHVRLCAGGAK